MIWALADSDESIILKCEDLEAIFTALIAYQVHLDAEIAKVENGAMVEVPSGLLSVAPIQREVIMELRGHAYDLRGRLVSFVGRDLTRDGC